jgi:hypothetical protein
MAAITTSQFKDHIRATYGELEDSTAALKNRVDRIFQRTHFYNISQRQAANKPLFGQTGSVSLTQPIIEQNMYVAEEACIVQSVTYSIPSAAGNGVSPVTVTTSVSDNWSIEVRRYKAATFSAVVTAASLTSTPTAIVPNLSRAVITCTNGTEANRTLAAGDVLTVRVTKNGPSPGAGQFRGGILKLTVDEA